MMQTDSNQFKVNLNAYSGPLDVLLDLAKSQKVRAQTIRTHGVLQSQPNP